MTKYWREDPRVPKYINCLEAGHKKAARESLSISDEWIAAIATRSILADNSFPTAQDKLGELQIASKTWTKWKDQFFDAKTAIDCAT